MRRVWFTAGWLLLSVLGSRGQNAAAPTQFLYGASVYPELQTREGWNKMLDQFQKARVTAVRVSESSWGNLETAPGQFNFGWLKEFLDDVARHNMKAILGTATYIPPQWLTAHHPETLLQLQPGVPVHPMYRKAACLNHPLYREACRRYIRTIGSEFRDHPAVIAWQLDNEIEFLLSLVCYNPACDKAWTDWLKNTYHTPAEFNRRLNLVSWGMQVSSLDHVPQPSQNALGDARRLVALTLASRHFRRDVILDFLIEQAQLLREAGVKQLIMTDWMPLWSTLADDPKAQKVLDIAGLNFYPPTENTDGFWTEIPWLEDVNRSTQGLNRFWVTETRFGAAATEGTAVTEASPTHGQFKMWGLQASAFGATAQLFWTGNRWRGGHWPHWGGLLDWTGEPEPDFPWAVELGEFYQKWGHRLLDYPVRARAAVLTDFEQRVALQVFPHVPESPRVVIGAFDALHRLGIGADAISTTRASKETELAKYSLVVIPAATALDHSALTGALEGYVRKGGKVVILPFTAYQDRDGIFRDDGFGANLSSLTGTLVRTVRRMGSLIPGERQGPQVAWAGASMDGISPVGLDGFCEFMEVAPEAQVIARFQSDESLLNGKPAASVRKLGQGAVFRLAFWPEDDSLLRLLAGILGGPAAPLGSLLPPGALAVPRTDGSMFIVNTTHQPLRIPVTKPLTDRISGGTLAGDLSLGAYGVVWVE